MRSKQYSETSNPMGEANGRMREDRGRPLEGSMFARIKLSAQARHLAQR